MQRTLARADSWSIEALPAGGRAKPDDMEKHWKERAHKLAGLVLNAEKQKMELQGQLEAALASPSADPGANMLSSLRADLHIAEAQLERQAEALRLKESLLRGAAGAARAEVLRLQQANADLRAEVSRLLMANSRMAAAGKAVDGAAPAARGKENVQGPPPSSASPARPPHVDVPALQSVLRQKDDELVVLRQDNADKQEELVRTLRALHASQTAAQDARREAANLAGQLDIVREALAQAGPGSEEEEEEEELQSHVEKVRAAQAALAVREGECAALAAEVAGLGEALAEARSEAGARGECAAVLAATLRERDREVGEGRAKVAELQCRLTGLLEGEGAPGGVGGASEAEAVEAHDAAAAEMEDDVAAALAAAQQAARCTAAECSAGPAAHSPAPDRRARGLQTVALLARCIAAARALSIVIDAMHSVLARR